MWRGVSTCFFTRLNRSLEAIHCRLKLRLACGYGSIDPVRDCAEVRELFISGLYLLPVVFIPILINRLYLQQDEQIDSDRRMPVPYAAHRTHSHPCCNRRLNALARDAQIPF
jgi:hypothetical protein